MGVVIAVHPIPRGCCKHPDTCRTRTRSAPGQRQALCTSLLLLLPLSLCMCWITLQTQGWEESRVGWVETGHGPDETARWCFFSESQKGRTSSYASWGWRVGEISKGNNRDMFLKSSPPFPRAHGLQLSLSGLQDATPGGKTAGVSWQMREFPEPLVKKTHGEGAAGAGGESGPWPACP